VAETESSRQIYTFGLPNGTSFKYLPDDPNAYVRTANGTQLSLAIYGQAEVGLVGGSAVIVALGAGTGGANAAFVQKSSIDQVRILPIRDCTIN
jgi:hypothetical protein